MKGEQQILSPIPVEDRIAVGDHCFLRKAEGNIAVFVRGIPITSYHETDEAAARLAIVRLVEMKAAKQKEITRAFDIERTTIFRYVRLYRDSGTQGIMPQKTGPKGPRVTGGHQDKIIRRLKEKGNANTQIAARLGIAEGSVRNALKRMGYQPTGLKQEPLAIEVNKEPNTIGSEVTTGGNTKEPSQAEPQALAEPTTRNSMEGSLVAGTDQLDQSQEQVGDAAAAVSEGLDLPVEHTVDLYPMNRIIDRMLAKKGRLEDAAPLFESAQGVPGAGVLLAVPVLVKHGVFVDTKRVFQSLGAAFYGLRNVTLTLLLCYLLGITRPEHLKMHAPKTLGRMIGLDRMPEMKTLRHKICLMAKQGCSLQLMQLQMDRHLKRLKTDLLWLYVDGHVSVYSGKGELPKHHVTRLRLSMPGMLDYWVNDEHGDPLMVYTGRPRKGVGSVLGDILAELRSRGEKRTITLVFDREGWSPEQFGRLNQMEGVRFATYRKASRGKKLPRLAKDLFIEHDGEFAGEKVKYLLADKAVYIDYGPKKNRKRLKCRQVTRMTETGKQTHIITNDETTPALELAHRMFSRWTQENFFKYLREHSDLDGLVTYLLENGDCERMVSNPARAGLKKEIEKHKTELEKLMASYGCNALENEESTRPTMRGFKIANGELGQQIRDLRGRIASMEESLKQIPSKVPLKVVLDGKEAKQAHNETRRLMHVFRMIAYRTEGALRDLVRGKYARWAEESRTLIRMFMTSPADIEVSPGELKVMVHPQSALHRTKVLVSLCGELNQLSARFPGSELVMRFGVRDNENVAQPA
jgi:transposase